MKHRGANNKKDAHLLLLPSEVPDAPAHVLEPGAPLPGVARRHHLDPRPVEVGLVDAGDDLLHEVLGRIEMATAVPHAHRRRHLLVIRDSPAAVQYRLQVPIDPFVSCHRRCCPSNPLTRTPNQTFPHQASKKNSKSRKAIAG